MEHPIALSIINDSSNYDARCRLYISSTEAQYRHYLFTLCVKKNREECIKFGSGSYSQEELQTATNDLYDSMKNTMEEWIRDYKADPTSVSVPPGYVPG